MSAFCGSVWALRPTLAVMGMCLAAFEQASAAVSIDISSSTQRMLADMAVLSSRNSYQELKSGLDGYFDQSASHGDGAVAVPWIPRAAMDRAGASPPPSQAQALSLGWKAVTMNFSMDRRANLGKAIPNAAWSLFTTAVAAGLVVADPLYRPSQKKAATTASLFHDQEGNEHLVLRAGQGGLVARLVQADGFTASQSLIVLKDSRYSELDPLHREGLFVHELVHARQWRDSHAVDFLFEYFRLNDEWGYLNNPKEQEAYDIEAHFLCARGDADGCRKAQDHSRPHSVDAPIINPDQPSS